LAGHHAKTRVMMKGRRSWFLAGAWAVTIFVLSSVPGPAMPKVEVLRYDKVLHALVYSVLGGLCFLAVRQTWTLTRGKVIAAATLCAVLYGLGDEFHQLFVPGRSADLYDALADGIGGLLGASVAAILPAAKSG
jgi:VanZ family protein